jgi:hypothetical protein
MFTHYLTYSFALNFQRDCFLLTEASHPQSTSLMSSADRMVAELGKAMECKENEVRAKALLVSVLCLRDCREVLERTGGVPQPMRGPYEILHGRLERLCSEAHDAIRCVSGVRSR